VSAEGHNPLCGDEIRIFIDVKDGLVSDVRFNGSGCSISQSSASMMTTAVKGKPVDQVRAIVKRFKQMMTIDEDDNAAIDESINLGDLEALQGVVKFPVRIKCATLGWNTLLDALVESGK
jgi:nitrogen fixation NifU-like protein